MEIETRLWKSSRKVWCRSTNSWGLEIWFWLQMLPSNVRNVLECFWSSELCSRYEISFKVFGKNCKLVMQPVCSFSCVLGLGYVMHMYLKLSRSKTKPIVHWINVLNILFSISFFQSFPCQSLPNLDDFVPFDLCTNLPAFLGPICFTKRLKKSNLLFSYNLN